MIILNSKLNFYIMKLRNHCIINSVPEFILTYGRAGNEQILYNNNKKMISGKIIQEIIKMHKRDSYDNIKE